MNSMTKHIPVCKNTTGNHEQNAEEESSTSEGERETVGRPTGKEAVGKPTGKTPDTQNVQDVTETVPEKRMMEEIPLSTREQVPRCLSPERREVTGESSSHTGRVRQQEVTQGQGQAVYPSRDHDYHDLIMHMLCNTLEESQEDDPNDSIVA